MVSCAAKTSGADSALDTASGGAGLGNATFSALIDGEPVSGGAIDDIQQQNAAYTIPGSNGGKSPTIRISAIPFAYTCQSS